MEKAGIQLSLTVAPAQQFQSGPMLNIQGDDGEQFNKLLEFAAAHPDLSPFFESYDISSAKTSAEKAAQISGAVPTPAATAAIPGPVVGAAPEAVTVGEGSNCPNCGTGALKLKTRRDGTGQPFLACDNYPACKYIHKS